MRAERAPHGRRGDETLRRAWRMSVAASALVLLVATPLRSTAQDWVYVAERGDNLWDLATEYLVSMRYWARFRALNDVPNPRRMPPGTVIRFPVEWLRVTAAPVEITQVAGQARIVRADASSEAAAVGATLGAGDRIVTGAAASAVLAFVDGSELLVRPSSDLTVEEAGLYGRLRRPNTRSRLGAGRIEGEVPAVGARPPRFEISTPAASAVVRGTRFRVGSEGEPPVARAEVEDGSVEIAGEQGRRVTLPAGTGTVVRAGQAPARPRELLPPVDLGALPARYERRQLRIGWPALTGARAYQVQITATASIGALLLDEQTPTPRVTLPDLDDGRYVLRVRAVDEVGLEGREALHAFELDARPEPPATISPRAGETVRIVRPTLRWASASDAASYRVHLFDDSDAEVVAVEAHPSTTLVVPTDLADGVYRWRIATRDESGDVGPFGDLQGFRVRKAPPAPEAESEASETGIALRWQAGRPGQGYEIQLADDEGFTESVRVEATDTPQITIEPPEKRLWFRVRIVDVDGYRGPFGTPQSIEPPPGDPPWWLALLPLLLLLAL